MPIFEYKVVPAPEKGRKGKGIKGLPGRFAFALEGVMNELGADGWEYVRADTLPCEERSGLTGTTTTYQNMLVFRREAASAAVAPRIAPRAAPEVAPVAKAVAEAAPDTATEVTAPPTIEMPPRSTATDAAAAAAAAALTAYRDSTSGAPKLGPAPERNPEPDSKDD